MATTVQECAKEYAETLPEESTDRRKLLRMAGGGYDELGLAKYLNDRALLPDDLKRKYRLDRPGANVTGEIPEESLPEYTGDVGLAAAAGLKTDPFARDATESAEVDVPEEVEDYNDLTVKQLQVVVSRRNADRDEDQGDYVIRPASDRKGDLVAALEEDDERG